MIDFLGDFGLVLLITSIFGLILCVFGWVFEKVVDTEKIAKWFFDSDEDED